MVLIVAEPTISGMSDMERIVKTAAKFGTKTAICVNKFNTNYENTDKIQPFCKKQGLPFVGKIPFDPEAVKAINRGQTIADSNCASGMAVKDTYNKTMQLLFKEGGG